MPDEPLSALLSELIQVANAPQNSLMSNFGEKVN